MAKDKFVLITVELLRELLKKVESEELKKKIRNILKTREVIEKQQVTKLPRRSKVVKVIDGDTVELTNDLVLRYVGMTAPETGEDFEKEATEANKKLVEGKTIKLEYDNYKSDKFGRILAYPILPDGTNVSIALVKKGLAELVIYQKRKPFIHHDKLLKAQNYAQKKKLGIWSKK